MPNSPPGDIPQGKDIPPGARWVTVHPHGPDAKGHPVLLSQDGVVLGGMGGVYNGRHLNDLYSENPKAWQHSYALPDYLNYWEPPEHSAHRRAFEHWGPEFDVRLLDHPEYEGGRWRARISNPHLENAVKAGYRGTPGGVGLELHPDGGVTYQGWLQHPGRSGYTIFATGMQRDVTNHIANYLAGEHEKKMPKGFLKRPIFFKPKPRLTEQERAPTAEAPWGYDVTGRKNMRSEPTDPLADPNWAPRSDLLAQGRGRQPRPPTFSDLGSRPSSPASHPVRDEPGMPAASTPTPTPVPPTPGAGAEGETLALPAPSAEDRAKSFFGEGVQRGMPALQPHPPSEPDLPDQAPGDQSPTQEPVGQNPEEELRGLFRAREEAAWHANDVVEQAQEAGRELTPEEQAEVEEAGRRIGEHGERLRALAGTQGWTSDDVRGLLGLDEEPESASPPAEEPQEAAGEGPAPRVSALDRIADEMAAENEQAPQEDASQAAPEEAPREDASQAAPVEQAPSAVQEPQPTPVPGSPGAMAQQDDWRTSGGVKNSEPAKSAAVPDEKSGGAEPGPVEEEPDDGWARWEAEQAAKEGGGRAALEKEAAELGVSPEELDEYRQDYARAWDTYTGTGGQLDQANRLISDIVALGGIHGSGYGDSEYAELPVAIKNRHAGHTLDTLLDELNSTYGYGFADTNELHQAALNAGRVQVEHGGIQAFGRGKQLRSKWAQEQARRRQNQQRRDIRALRKQGVAPVHRRGRGGEEDVRLAADPDELVRDESPKSEPMDSPSAGARYELGDDDYAVPAKRLLPIFSAMTARRSWDALDRTPDLSAAERKEAEARILDALHVLGLPEHEAPPELPAAGDEEGAASEPPTDARAAGGPDDGIQRVAEPGTGAVTRPPVEAGAETEQENDQEMGKQRIPPEVAAEAESEGETPEHEMEEKASGTEYGPADLEEDQARAEDEEGDEDDEEGVREAVLDADARDDLSDAKFACPELGKLPIHDAAHVRNAMARFNQTQGLSPEQKKAAWGRITRAAKRFGVSVSPDQHENREDVREAEPVRLPDRIPVQFMSVGHGNRKDGHFYTEDAVRALVGCVREQPKMFISHSDQSQVQRHGHRPLEQLGAVAVRESVRYDPVRRATLGEVVLRPAMREFVETAHAAGDTIGISVDGKGLFRPGTKECVGWSQFYSADFVPKGGAGGFTLAVRESERPDLAEEEKEFVKVSLLDSLSTQDVREGNPALFEAIGREYAAANPVTETVREADTTEVERLVRENETLSSERDQALARMDELEAERNREQVARFVDQLVRECGIEQAQQVAYISRLFGGATCGPRGTYQTREELEGAVRETAQEYLATLPPAPPSGEITGQGAARGEAMQQTEGWTNPFTVINDGMAMLWGHQPERKSPEKNGAATS